LTRVALVGVGTMGLPMGRRLLLAGHEVVACDTDPARASALGVPLAATPAEAFSGCEVAITSLPSVRAVEQVVLGPAGLLAAAHQGSTLIEMSTSPPSLARRLAVEGEAAGAEVLDAPVSGGPRGAEDGTLTIMVGGRAETVDRMRGVFECLGRVIHAGGHGAGQALKLCNNMLAGCAMAALAEASRLALDEGIEPEVLYAALTTSTGDSRVLRTRFPVAGVDPGHPASAGYRPLFELDLLVKDLVLARALADEHGVETPVTAAALAEFRDAQRAGHGKLDYSAVYLSRGPGGRRGGRPAPAETPARFPEPRLRAFGERVLGGVGVAPGVAGTVLDCLLEADRRGVHTHGLLRLPAYCAQVRSGEVDAAADPVVVQEEGATALVDGRFAFGAVSGTFAADDAVRRALDHGIAATAVRNGNHFGSAGHYSLRIARRGLVGLVACNTPAAMAPWGASDSRLGNNPLSIAAPAVGGRPPLVADMALSAVSRGRIKLAELNGEEIPPTWALDPSGAPTSDPAAALAGALLPVGGHKGSGLAVAIEALTAALSGAGISPRLVNTGLTGAPGAESAERGSGYLVIAIDPARFAGREAFASRLGDLVDELKAARLAPGFEEVLVPGEPEHLLELTAEVDGVPLPAPTLEALEALAAGEGIAFPG
jgi:3-hydroxyisobutyrate dehydrogenase